MNKNQQKMVHYSNVMNAVMSGTEEEQNRLSPKFTALRKAIDDKQLAEFDAGEYASTHELFTAGTAHYAELLAQLEATMPPARFIGTHKRLISAYRDFVAGCEAMTASLGETPADLDQPAFDAAEKAQDEATEHILTQLSKITRLA
ncbi:hypothetical protein [Lacticaseibacillus suibinensis]|uniref:hypothetical protein n=1 Tax=Lacticaseibacillus suibinensis TaxID=2486011 RepID=UPI000F77506C|nr:hypothetical protein [Lacticaseibacillus suibinensis]